MALRPPSRGFSVSRRLSERARAAAQADAARSTGQSEAVDIDIPGIGGLAGMVGTLRGLLEQFAATAQGRHQGHTTSQSADNTADNNAHTVSLGGGNARMVFGYTLRMGPDGIAAEPFGNVPPARPEIQADPAANVAPAALQPIVEVFEDGDAVVVVAELPGADPEAIVCRADGKQLLIEASGARHYRKSLLLPAPVRSEDMRQSFRNGILEVRMARADLP